MSMGERTTTSAAKSIEAVPRPGGLRRQELTSDQSNYDVTERNAADLAWLLVPEYAAGAQPRLVSCRQQKNTAYDTNPSRISLHRTVAGVGGEREEGCATVGNSFQSVSLSPVPT
jgi:hypothetical protein